MLDRQQQAIQELNSQISLHLPKQPKSQNNLFLVRNYDPNSYPANYVNPI